MRLFVAFNIPANLAREAMACQPSAEENIRLSPMANLHVTLHFLGDANAALVHRALQTIQLDSFVACLNGTGQFSLSGNKKILWLGIDPSDALLSLHDAINKSLLDAGLGLSKQQYQPHLTLARCKSGYSEQSVNHFLNKEFEPSKFKVNGFSLFNSEVCEGTQVYTCLHSYGLA